MEQNIPQSRKGREVQGLHPKICCVRVPVLTLL
jgi:hypothetical protein